MKPPRIITNDHGKVKLTVERRVFNRHQTVDLTSWMTTTEMQAWLATAQVQVAQQVWPLNATAPRVLP